MWFNIAASAIRLLEVLFFTGLLGCAVVVIFCWILIGRDSFSGR